MSDFLQRIECNLQDRCLLARGQTVLAAVSGGLDSMVLLHALRTHSVRHRWKLTVAHFNHRLRGRSSDADEQIVRKTAVTMKLPVVIERADVRRFARKSKLSIEMAARKLRHEFFARTAGKLGVRAVALAHHADDQVELFFLRLLRGAGGEGLAGMKWCSPSPADGKLTLIRPLLDLTRAELRDFARENKIPFRQDATNDLMTAPRNRIRNELLPLLRKKYQPGLTRTVLRLMDIIGAEADTASETARQWLKETRKNNLASRPRKSQCSVPAFVNLPIAIQRRVLQLQLGESGILADFELVERLRRCPDASVSISPGLFVARDVAGSVQLRRQPAFDFADRELTVQLADRAGDVDFDGVQFHWNVEDSNRRPRFTQGLGREFFDADKVGRQVTLRHWRPGDRFRPIGAESLVKLQDWFVNRKIPRGHRHRLVIACAASREIFWIEDLRIGENFKLTSQTKRRLVWNWKRSGKRGTREYVCFTGKSGA